MREYFDQQLWQKAANSRTAQRFLGYISGFFLLVALVSLFDGLTAEMRQGATTLDLLRDGEIVISGPSALKNPVTSDLGHAFSPKDAPLQFELDGFYTGYWFGNGMWRGKIMSNRDAEPGEYHLRVFFKGAAGQGAQNYDLRVFEDAAGMRAASFSHIRRYLDLNPFILAAITGIFGFMLGVATYCFGRRYLSFLGQLGLSEIYHSKRHDGQYFVYCLVNPGPFTPKPGNVRMVLAPDGTQIGEARAEKLHKNKLMLTMLDDSGVPPGSLVCIAPPMVHGTKADGEKE
jgi:hypothetical protein